MKVEFQALDEQRPVSRHPVVPQPTSDPLSLLRHGRDLIKMGWCKGTFSKSNAIGQRVAWCARGAVGDNTDAVMALALTLAGSPQHYHRYFLQSLADTNISGSDLIAYYNDRSSTTKSDILDLFNRAIAAEEEWLSRPASI